MARVFGLEEQGAYGSRPGGGCQLREVVKKRVGVAERRNLVFAYRRWSFAVEGTTVPPRETGSARGSRVFGLKLQQLWKGHTQHAANENRRKPLCQRKRENLLLWRWEDRGGEEPGRQDDSSESKSLAPIW